MTAARRWATAILLATATAACGRGEGAGAGPAPGPEPGEPPRPDPVETPAPPAPAPWSEPPLAAEGVPSVFLTEWREAENRETCALLAPASVEYPEARPRAAYFGGGWGVAYDLPGLRSAFGIAGTGVEPGPDTYDDWPHHRHWADGSRAGYGPEGGSGPRQLAYLRVAGQPCLYNVWSNLSVQHLERFLERLRFVGTTDR